MLRAESRSPLRIVLAVLGAALTASALLASGAGAPPTAEARRMAITVDDLPAAPPGRHDVAQQTVITERLLAALAERGATAVGFVNESRLEDEGTLDPRRVEFLVRWLEAGHELGNHGYGHLDLHRVDTEGWLADVLRGERVTRPLVETRGGTLRWFRHPFLHTGRTLEALKRTEGFLAEHGYRVAPVTVDNGEWLYGGAYAAAWNRGDEAAMRRLGEDYVRYMLDVVGYYERQSREIVGELIPQVLLVHAYALNGDWLSPLLEELEARGYSWLRMEKALEHPAYARSIRGYTGPGGITWLHRWAITEGRDPAVFRGEPKVPEWVRQLAEAARPRPGHAPEP